jgi:hypothetical protein
MVKPRRTCFELSKLENLAERIYHGQVVFFVGAGFSLDSEGLTGARLLLRLLARFDALSSTLIGGAAPRRVPMGIPWSCITRTERPKVVWIR